jgi:regulator of sigma E protease
MDIVATLTLIVTLIFWFVIIVIPLVIVHEFGHTIMSWLFKIRVVEYGVGMPPRTPIKFRFRKMLYSLNWLPLGGFAKIYGDR